MDPRHLELLLKHVAKGKLGVPEALKRLKTLPFESLGFANLDHHRMLRTGIPEVIYGESKTTEQIILIAQRVVAAKEPLLVTRVDEEKGFHVQQAIPGSIHDPRSRTVRYALPSRSRKSKGLVAVVTAGTSDIPIAEEAAITVELMGGNVERIFDVGVAGVHRLLDKVPVLQQARAIVVAAGMEGALASIVGGLVACPVIALPTSIGYGASFGGLSALLGMLTSCAPGVTVVNIDNGFGAGVAAGLISRR